MTQAGSARIAPQFRLWQSEQDCGAMLINVIGNVSVHNEAPNLLAKSERLQPTLNWEDILQAINQTSGLCKSFFFNRKRRAERVYAEGCSFFCTFRPKA